MTVLWRGQTRTSIHVQVFFINDTPLFPFSQLVALGGQGVGDEFARPLPPHPFFCSLLEAGREASGDGNPHLYTHRGGDTITSHLARGIEPRFRWESGRAWPQTKPSLRFIPLNQTDQSMEINCRELSIDKGSGKKDGGVKRAIQTWLKSASVEQGTDGGWPC